MWMFFAERESCGNRGQSPTPHSHYRGGTRQIFRQCDLLQKEEVDERGIEDCLWRESDQVSRRFSDTRDIGSVRQLLINHTRDFATIERNNNVLS